MKDVNGGTRRDQFVWFGILILLMSAGCASIWGRGPIPTPLPDEAIQKSAEKTIGETLSRMMSTLPSLGRSVLNDSYVSKYVTDTFHHLLDKTHTHHDGFPGTVVVLDDLSKPQAMSLPGGFLIVYSGLVCDVQNEDEFVGVIAHELGHDVKRDAFGRIQEMAGIIGLSAGAKATAIVSALGQSRPGAVLSLIQQTVAVGIVGNVPQKWSAQEEAADQDAPGYAKITGYNPCGFAQFLSRSRGQKPPDATRLSKVERACEDHVQQHDQRQTPLAHALLVAKQKLIRLQVQGNVPLRQRLNCALQRSELP